MAATLTIADETVGGATTHELVVEFLTERITVRELIRGRVYQEVQDYNRKLDGHFRGLVRPTDADDAPAGFRLRTRREIDWKAQFDRAVEAFDRNGFFILIDDKQAECLDEPIVLRPDTRVSFVKLTPLVGG